MNDNKFLHFTTKELVTMAVLVAVSGVAQVLWADLVFGTKLLGPIGPLFTNAGFIVWCFLATYLVPKRGSATIVKGFAAVIEVLLGNPVGPIAIAYGTLEGFAVDVAFWLFKDQLSTNMFIIGALLSQLFNAPIDFVRDAVPFEFFAMLTYWAPGVAGTVFSGWIGSLVINALRRANVKPVSLPSS